MANLESAVRKPLFDEDSLCFSPLDRVALASLVKKLDCPEPRIVEVGSWVGDGSTSVFIEELRGSGGSLYCVDTWRGSANVEKHQRVAAAFDVFGSFRNNVARAGGADIVKPLVMTSKEAGAIVGDGAFDLVFIDADHSYEAVREDIEIWRHNVRPGGFLCGHDCEGRAGEFGAERLRACLDADSIAGNARFARVHPGCVLAVDEAFAGRAGLFAEQPFSLPGGGQGYSSIWYKRM